MNTYNFDKMTDDEIRINIIKIFSRDKLTKKEMRLIISQLNELFESQSDSSDLEVLTKFIMHYFINATYE